MDDRGPRTPAPVRTAHLFRTLHAALLDVLVGLTPEEWERPTTAGAWRVRDVAAHLLDGDLRRLSLARDGHRLTPPPGALEDEEGLVAWLDALNAEWVRVAQRLSPRVLRELLAISGAGVADLVESLDPFEPAAIPVAWAGEATSPNWMDVGRELTERWHHQEQIREAVSAPPLTTPDLLGAVVGISLRALPHAYRDVAAPAGTALRIRTTGDAGAAWSLVRQDDGWALFEGSTSAAAATVALSAHDAARVLLHLGTPREGTARARIDGDASLARPFFRARAVMVRAPESSAC